MRPLPLKQIINNGSASNQTSLSGLFMVDAVQNTSLSTCEHSQPEAMRQLDKRLAEKLKLSPDLSSELDLTQQKRANAIKPQAEERNWYQGEIDRLTLELESRRKMHAENTQQTTALRKQHEEAQYKVKELKRVVLADQVEIKELKSKTQKLEQSKSQADLRQEVERLKKAMQQAESKQKAELANRDVKINQLQRALSQDLKKKDTAERKIGNIKAKADAELNDSKNCIRALKERNEDLESTMKQLEHQVVSQQRELTALRDMLSQITHMYGQLARNSVSTEKYRREQLAGAFSQFRVIRLERRLADREAIIEQLTDYCRQTKEERNLFYQLLHESDEEIGFLLASRSPELNHDIDHNSLTLDYIDLDRIIFQDRVAINNLNIDVFQALAQYLQIQSNDMLLSYAASDEEVKAYSLICRRLFDDYLRTTEDLESLRQIHAVSQEQLVKRQAECAEVRDNRRLLEDQLAAQGKRIAELEKTVQREYDRNVKLQQARNCSEQKEERLLMELDYIMKDLDDANRYKEAHADLLSEVVELIQRNELAEAEAERLSKFNAEILGHKNPQQRILYVDRIRQELAEAKQRLMKSTRDREELEADKVALQTEVAAYKSIYVSSELKVPATRVRVERPPLQPKSINSFTMQAEVS